MKKVTIFFAASILTVALFVSTAFKPLPAGPSANGQGALDLGAGTKIQHFSFHANTANDGTVSGSFEVKSADQAIRLHGTITCLKIRPDNKTAFMSGVITQKVGDGFPGFYNVGDFVYFEVQDNGEGANASNDKFSDVFTSGVTQFCGPFLIGMANIVNGNIQVKP